MRVLGGFFAAEALMNVKHLDAASQKEAMGQKVKS